MTDPVDFIPAGPTRCCEQADWLGRKASTAPLPASFIKAAVAGGSLVPPHTGVDRPGYVILYVVLGLAATCAGVVWFIVNFTKV